MHYRILSIAGLGAEAACRERWRELARRPGVQLTALAPGEDDDRGSAEGYELFTRKPCCWLLRDPKLRRAWHAHFHLGGLVRLARADLVEVWAEPGSLLAWLAFRAASRHGARRIFFSGEAGVEKRSRLLGSLENAVLLMTDGALFADEAVLRRHLDQGWTGRHRVLAPAGGTTLGESVSRQVEFHREVLVAHGRS